MRVLLLANYIPDAQQSMQRFAELLDKELTAAGHEVRVLRPAPVAQRVAIGKVGTKWLGHIDKYLVFPKSLRRLAEWPEIVHICDHSNSVYLKYLSDKPSLITCHDLFGIRGGLGDTPVKVSLLARQLQRKILSGLREAHHIACVSDATRNELSRVAGIDHSKIFRIYNGLNYPYTPMRPSNANVQLEKLGALGYVPFILHVGGNQWYKNRLGLLKLFAQMRNNPSTRHLKLITVGKPWTPEMLQFAEKAQLGKAVLTLTGTTEEDLRALYSTAELMLFPSLAEGFGWPVAEAQACRCPVVATNRAPMTEVGAGAAIYFDPQDPAAATDAVISAIRQKRALGELGLQNVVRFNPTNMVRQYISLYEKIIATPVALNDPLLRDEELELK